MNTSQLLEMESPVGSQNAEEPWQILVVDDDRDIHALTSIILNDFQFQNRPLRIHYARTTTQAIDTLNEFAGIQLMLIDMVMEDKDSGIQIIDHLRATLENNRMQVIVRTSVREMIPNPAFVKKYNILDCKIKSEMTAHVFRETIHESLEAYLAAGQKDGIDKDFLLLGLARLKGTKLSDEQGSIVQDLLNYLN